MIEPILAVQLQSTPVRRSGRDPSVGHLDRSEVKILLSKIRGDHPDTVILKLKDHLMSDINSVVLDEIIAALGANKVCQALYFQNLSKAMNDEQLAALVLLVKKKKIWCMNLGENYNVTTNGWVMFCNSLPMTFVTHLYVSEHVISSDLKNRIRAHIRENRKKHDKHCSLKNIHVIEKCTNMWWNPINAIRHQFAADIAREERERAEREREEREKQERKERAHLEKHLEKLRLKAKEKRCKRPLDVMLLTPAHAEYWAEGVGEGGEKPWKFSCSCGEKCSSYEHFRYHPVGRMFECSSCSLWGHVLCVLGNICDDDLEELPEVLCAGCRSKLRRQRLKDLTEAGIVLGANGIPLLRIEVAEATEVTEDVGTDGGLDDDGLVDGLCDGEMAARVGLDSPAEGQHESQIIADILVGTDVYEMVGGGRNDSISNNYNDDNGSNSTNDNNRKRNFSGDDYLERVVNRAVGAEYCSAISAAAFLPDITCMDQTGDNASKNVGNNSYATHHVDHKPVSDSPSNSDATTPLTDDKEVVKSSSVRVAFNYPDIILRDDAPRIPDSKLLMSDRCFSSRTASSSSASSSSPLSIYSLPSSTSALFSSSSVEYRIESVVSATTDSVNSNNFNGGSSTDDNMDDNRDSSCSSGITDNNDSTSNEFSGTDDDCKDNSSSNVDNECSSGSSTETDDDCLLPLTYYKHIEPRTHSIDLLKTIIKNNNDSDVLTDSNREVFVST